MVRCLSLVTLNVIHKIHNFAGFYKSEIISQWEVQTSKEPKTELTLSYNEKLRTEMSRNRLCNQFYKLQQCGNKRPCWKFCMTLGILQPVPYCKKHFAQDPPHGAVTVADGVCFCGLVHISCFHHGANISFVMRTRIRWDLSFNSPCKSCTQADAALRSQY